jgi:putative RNA 2'-phosphotransferase
MDTKRLVRISKYLSKHLRHEPERLGLRLEPGGWVQVDDLLAACAADHFSITRDELIEVVQQNDKQRFSFDPSKTRIRANQGHSTPVDLQLEPVPPPDILYHGTPAGSVDVILHEGLKKMARHDVHLSATAASAETVGRRRGRPVVLVVDAAAMSRDGHVFYCSANGVWLTDYVPPKYLRRMSRSEDS